MMLYCTSVAICGRSLSVLALKAFTAPSLAKLSAYNKKNSCHVPGFPLYNVDIPKICHANN